MVAWVADKPDLTVLGRGFCSEGLQVKGPGELGLVLAYSYRLSSVLHLGRQAFLDGLTPRNVEVRGIDYDDFSFISKAPPMSVPNASYTLPSLSLVAHSLDIKRSINSPESKPTVPGPGIVSS